MASRCGIYSWGEDGARTDQAVSAASPDCLGAHEPGWYALAVGRDPQGTVPGVGECAPDFSARDADGAEQRLSELATRPNTVLVFYRGHW